MKTYIIEYIPNKEIGILKLYKLIPMQDNYWDVYLWHEGEWDYHDNIGKESFNYMMENATTIFEEKKL